MGLTIDQTLQQAIEAHNLGKLQDAERLYRTILGIQPKHPDANHNLGVLAVGVGQPEAALPFLKAALEANQQRVQFWISYINALIAANLFIEAKITLNEGKRLGLAGDSVQQLEQRLEQFAHGSHPKQSHKTSEENIQSVPKIKEASPTELLSEEPSQQEIDALLSNYNAGNLALAEQLATSLTRKFLNHAFGWKALGAIAQSTGRLQDALAPMQQAARLAPHDVEAHSNLGNTLRGLGRLTQAEASCREAIRLKPDYAEAHTNLGNALNDLGRLTQAEASYREAIRLKPDLAEAHSNLGNTLKDLGRLTQAEASYREAIRLKPGYAEAHSNLGNALNDLRRLVEAQASYREAIRLKPDYAEAHTNLGNTLKDLRRLTEAQASYREAIRLKPDFPEAHDNLLFSLNYVESLSTEAALLEANRYGSIVSARATPKFTSWSSDAQSTKLRIGFVSGDLRNHPVGYFIEGLIKHLGLC